MTFALVAATVLTFLVGWVLGIIALYLGAQASPTGGTLWGISIGNVFFGAVTVPTTSDPGSSSNG